MIMMWKQKKFSADEDGVESESIDQAKKEYTEFSR
jgi:hypothetical protein